MYTDNLKTISSVSRRREKCSDDIIRSNRRRREEIADRRVLSRAAAKNLSVPIESACEWNKNDEKKRGSPNAHPHASKRSPRHGGERRKGIYRILCIRPAAYAWLAREKFRAMHARLVASRASPIYHPRWIFAARACLSRANFQSFRVPFYLALSKITAEITLIRTAWNLLDDTRKVVGTKWLSFCDKWTEWNKLNIALYKKSIIFIGM